MKTPLRFDLEDMTLFFKEIFYFRHAVRDKNSTHIKKKNNLHIQFTVTIIKSHKRLT